MIIAWLNKVSTSCNIVCAFLLSSGKYKISCILQSASSRFVEKLFFICERNQFVRSNKLPLWSAEFFASLPLKVEIIVSFTNRFLSYPTLCGNSCWIIWFEISCKGSLTRISYFSMFEVSRAEKRLLEWRVGILGIPCILISNEDCKYCFINCGVLRLRCSCFAIRLGKSSLFYNFIVSFRQGLSSEEIDEWIFINWPFNEISFSIERTSDPFCAIWYVPSFLFTRLKLRCWMITFECSHYIMHFDTIICS